MYDNERPLIWIASSYKDLMALAPKVRRRFGFALSLAQMGDQYDAAKVLKGFGGGGVLEVVEDDAGGTYRAVYTVKFVEAVFVALLPEEEQGRDRHAEGRHGHHPRSPEGVRGDRTGATQCKNRTLKA